MLRVIAVFDGRPGHEKQTKGIIAALSRRVAVKLHPIDLSKISIFQRIKNCCYLLFPFLAPGNTAFAESDLVIGAGRKTHVLSLMLKRKYGVVACTCMTPDWPLIKYFDCCFVPRHDSTLPAKNTFYTLGAPNPCVDKGKHQNNQCLVLLGGIDKRSHYWDCEDISDKVLRVVKKEPQKFWTIASSPRTPLSTANNIRKGIAALDNAIFFDYRDTPRGWIEEQYDRCETVWVTSDSISMLYEALTSGCRVYLFPMEWVQAQSKFQINESMLLKKGVVGCYDNRLSHTHSRLSTYNLNEAQRCADHILKTWPLKNLL